jgi:hypothetical protein
MSRYRVHFGLVWKVPRVPRSRAVLIDWERLIRPHIIAFCSTVDGLELMPLCSRVESIESVVALELRWVNHGMVTFEV